MIIKVAEIPETWVQTSAIKEIQVVNDKLEIGFGSDHCVIVHVNAMEVLRVILKAMLDDHHQSQ